VHSKWFKGKEYGWLTSHDLICSHYDTSGRVRKGPAPYNLEVPSEYFHCTGDRLISVSALHSGHVSLLTHTTPHTLTSALCFMQHTSSWTTTHCKLAKGCKASSAWSRAMCSFYRLLGGKPQIGGRRHSWQKVVSVKWRLSRRQDFMVPS
jgi:hypothetical protein